MIRRSNFSGGDRNRGDSAAWTQPAYPNPLDQERAASMADEGGASGAHVDAAGPDSAALVGARSVRQLRRRRPGPWLIGAALLGLAFAAGWLLRRRA